MTAGAGIGEYLKRAFLYRWNLLLFFGSFTAGLLSPWPDAVTPLILAGELAYLAGLVSIPRFREAVDAQVHKESQRPVIQGSGAVQSLADVVNALTPDSRRRFEALRARCLEMRSIARGIGNQQTSTTEDLSTPALDRLLWIFLRLLRSQQSIDQFLRSTNADQIKARIDEAKTKLAAAPAVPSTNDERFKRSLQDNIAAQEMRLENYLKAGANAEFVRVELDRIEAKIQALAESGVNRQDPDTLSSQIEGVAESVQTTETAMRELQQITGLVDQMQEPPAILEADFRKVAQ
jgi:hypothetical protein